MSAPNTPVIVMSENGRHGAMVAMKILRQGGTALDAVEAACRYVEDDINDRTVGRGGTPNVLGQVELDASIMDGRTLQAGAVAALRGYGKAITLARQVMTELPHVLVVGEGAARFAAEMGHAPEDQLTPETHARWQARFAEAGIELNEADLRGNIDRLRYMTGQLTRPMNLTEQIDKSKLTTGTVNFLARDMHGDLASAVSTSGLGWKYPGRVGDSPADRRGQLLRQPLRRCRLHRHGRTGHPGQHGPQSGSVHEDGHEPAGSRPGNPARSAGLGQARRAIHEHRRPHPQRRRGRIQRRPRSPLRPHDRRHGRAGVGRADYDRMRRVRDACYVR